MQQLAFCLLGHLVGIYSQPQSGHLHLSVGIPVFHTRQIQDSGRARFVFGEGPLSRYGLPPRGTIPGTSHQNPATFVIAAQ